MQTLTKRIGFEYIRELIDCASPYGTELVRKLAPYSDEGELKRELINISRAIAAEADAERMTHLTRLLMTVKNIRRSIENIGEGALDEVELFEIKRFLLQIREIKQEYENLSFSLEGVSFPNCSEALDILCIDGNCTAGFYIADSYSKKLKDIRTRKREAERDIRQAEGTEAEKLKVERLKIVAEEADEEARIRHELSERLMPYRAMLLDTTTYIAKLDFTLAKARLAMKTGAVMPVICEGSIEYVNMRNPYFEKTLRERGRDFMPVSICAHCGSTVITGANMGGKSVALKTLALNAYTAMCGMFVFCESAKMPMLNGIAMIAEDHEDTENGLSTFGGEIMRLKDELKNTDKCCLLIFDELASGTNPQEGARIVKAVVKYFNGKKAIAVFATHYDGVAACAKKHYRVVGLRDFNFENADGKNGLELMMQFMNYGLYEALPDEKCPREAIGICRMLLKDEPLLEVLLNEK